MQRRELNCAIIEVANNRDIGGRVTADEIYRGLRTGKERKLWRIACSTFLGSLMVAGLFIFLAPLPGRANDDEDKRADNQKNRRAEIEALRVQVESLQATVSALQDQVTTLQSQLTAVQSNHALLLAWAFRQRRSQP
jgi:septal ring factor EnvC (AmiA/AmiB activator)